MSMNNPNAAAGWPPNPVQANPVPANGWPPNPAPANSWPVNPAPTNSWAMNPAPANGWPANPALSYPALANPAPASPAPAYQPPAGPLPTGLAPAYTPTMTTAPANPAPAAPTQTDGCLAWDAEISDDGAEYLILPEGVYLGQVVNYERGFHEASAKLEACEKVTVYMEFPTEAGVARVRTELYLLQKMEWKISSFLRCIGLKKRGESYRLDWTKIPGTWGRVHLRPVSYKGSEINEIVRFLDYDPALMPPLQQNTPAPPASPGPPASPAPQTASAPSAVPISPAPAASPVQQTMQGLQGPAVPPGFTNVTGDIEPPW